MEVQSLSLEQLVEEDPLLELESDDELELSASRIVTLKLTLLKDGRSELTINVQAVLEETLVPVIFQRREHPDSDTVSLLISAVKLAPEAVTLLQRVVKAPDV